MRTKKTRTRTFSRVRKAKDYVPPLPFELTTALGLVFEI